MADNKIISIPDGKICDYVDGKFRNDTPEEYVRQTIEKRLINEHKYGASQIKIEYTLQLGSRKPRADIVIFKKDCTEQKQENVYIIRFFCKCWGRRKQRSFGKNQMRTAF